MVHYSLFVWFIRYQLKLIEYIFLAYFYFYLITHINVFSLILLLLYFLYGSIYVYTLPNGFLNISILVLYVYIVLKFCLQSEFIYQYVNEQGYYYFSFEVFPMLILNTNSTWMKHLLFSPIHSNISIWLACTKQIGIKYPFILFWFDCSDSWFVYYVVPVCSEIGYDVALVFFFIFYKLTLKVFHCMSFQVNRIWASERRILLCTSTIIIWQIFKIWRVRLLTLQTRIKSIIALCRGYLTSVWLPKFVEVFLSYCSQNVWLSKWIWFPE